MHGVINVYKEPGLTSFQVVARIRKIFNVKKAGHTGTLDPMAEGVLPVCIGHATRFADIITAGEKQYIAKFTLGAAYDTFDTTGAVVATSDKVVSEEEVRKALAGFIGSVELTVPVYSAKKVDGRRAYELARKGEEVDLGKSAMQIHSIELLSFAYPEGSFVMDCAKGTYVRSVIHEMGERLGCYAAMSGLIRSRNGNFLMTDAMKLGYIEEEVKQGRALDLLIDIPEAVNLPIATVKDEAIARLFNGIAPRRDEYVDIPDIDGLCLLLAKDERLLALGETQGGAVRLMKVFNT